MVGLFTYLKLYLATRFKGERGVTTVEYAVMLALVAIAVAMATPNIRTAVLGVFNQVQGALDTASGTGGTA